LIGLGVTAGLPVGSIGTGVRSLPSVAKTMRTLMRTGGTSIVGTGLINLGVGLATPEPKMSEEQWGKKQYEEAIGSPEYLAEAAGLEQSMRLAAYGDVEAERRVEETFGEDFLSKVEYREAVGKDWDKTKAELGPDEEMRYSKEFALMLADEEFDRWFAEEGGKVKPVSFEEFSKDLNRPMVYEPGLAGIYARGVERFQTPGMEKIGSIPVVGGFAQGMATYFAPHTLVTQLYPEKGLKSLGVLAPHFGTTAVYVGLTWKDQPWYGKALGIGGALLPFALGPAGSGLGWAASKLKGVHGFGPVIKAGQTVLKPIKWAGGKVEGATHLSQWAPWRGAYSASELVGRATGLATTTKGNIGYWGARWGWWPKEVFLSGQLKFRGVTEPTYELSVKGIESRLSPESPKASVSPLEQQLGSIVEMKSPLAFQRGYTAATPGGDIYYLRAGPQGGFSKLVTGGVAQPSYVPFSSDVSLVVGRDPAAFAEFLKTTQASVTTGPGGVLEYHPTIGGESLTRGMWTGGQVAPKVWGQQIGVVIPKDPSYFSSVNLGQGYYMPSQMGGAYVGGSGGSFLGYPSGFVSGYGSFAKAPAGYGWDLPSSWGLGDILKGPSGGGPSGGSIGGPGLTTLRTRLQPKVTIATKVTPTVKPTTPAPGPTGGVEPAVSPAAGVTPKVPPGGWVRVSKEEAQIARANPDFVVKEKEFLGTKEYYVTKVIHEPKAEGGVEAKAKAWGKRKTKTEGWVPIKEATELSKAGTHVVTEIRTNPVTRTQEGYVSPVQPKGSLEVGVSPAVGTSVVTGVTQIPIGQLAIEPFVSPVVGVREETSVVTGVTQIPIGQLAIEPFVSPVVGVREETTRREGLFEVPVVGISTVAGVGVKVKEKPFVPTQTIPWTTPETVEVPRETPRRVVPWISPIPYTSPITEVGPQLEEYQYPYSWPAVSPITDISPEHEIEPEPVVVPSPKPVSPPTTIVPPPEPFIPPPDTTIIPPPGGIIPPPVIELPLPFPLFGSLPPGRARRRRIPWWMRGKHWLFPEQVFFFMNPFTMKPIKMKMVGGRARKYGGKAAIREPLRREGMTMKTMKGGKV